ncbi:MAG: hypothetical protein IKD90_06700 [Clostridiales bacterium]|nr:hypothetical protein [Clostridiales bacterium]
MKKRTMAIMVLTMTMAFSACGKAAPSVKTSKIAVNAQSTSVGATAPTKAPDLFGDPDTSKVGERGLMASKSVERPIISDIRSVYTVINWQLYSELVSGSELTVEPIISEARDEDAPNELLLYVFAYNEDYAWNKEDAIVKITGSSCHPIVDQDYNTIHVYWMQGRLPADMPSGKYTFVFATVEGQVDSMVDLEIVKPKDAKSAPVSID